MEVSFPSSITIKYYLIFAARRDVSQRTFRTTITPMCSTWGLPLIYRKQNVGSDGPSISTSHRCLLIGGFIALILYVLELTLLYYYLKSSRSKKDHWLLKSTVFLVIISDTFSILAGCATSFQACGFSTSRVNFRNIST